ncbi:MAG: serine/threonine-protein kinase [Pseudomonadota bacterium]
MVASAALALQLVDDQYTQTQVFPAGTELASTCVHLPARPRRKTAAVGDEINGRFLLQAEIGRGGMGRVFKALDKRKLEAHSRAPHVAIKVMTVAEIGVEAATVALEREVQRSQSLTHRHIVRVNDFDRDGDTVFATMELLEGDSLRKRIDAAGPGGLAPTLARRLVRQAGEALAYAHANGILHADFKPSNVFVTRDADAKVIDFGIARAYQPNAAALEQTRFDPRALGAMTPAYASPEMLEHKAPDPRDDVYALGCVAYEALTGTHPFGRMPANQARDLGHRPPRPAKLNRREWAALERTLRFDRASRTPTVAQFVEAFVRASGRRPTRTRRRRLPVVSVLLAMAGMAVAAPWALLPSPADEAMAGASPSTVAMFEATELRTLDVR